MIQLAPRIVVDERVRFGQPVIEGTRVPVDVVLGKLAAGMTSEAVAEEYGLTATMSSPRWRMLPIPWPRRKCARFLVDEDLPRSLAPWLNAAGLGLTDEEITGNLVVIETGRVRPRRQP